MNLSPEFLRCEYLINPLGIDVKKPRLSWVLKSDKRAERQTAYRILVTTGEDGLEKENGDLWDTGKVTSDQTTHIIYQGKPLESGMQCFWKVMVWDNDGNPSDWSEHACWSMGLLTPADWRANWIGAPKKRLQLGIIKSALRKLGKDPSQLLRKTFIVNRKVHKAVAYVSALGEYELSLNCNRIGNHLLAPEWTDYDKRIQYQTYDVTASIQMGDNVLGAVLADGWYAGNLMPTTGSRVWGKDRRFLCQLVIEFVDGNVQEIISDASWKIYTDGPIRRADHYLGEIYDARKEQSNWESPGFDDNGWLPATIDSTVQVNLVAQMNEPIRIIEEIRPISMSEPKPDVFIFDMGQNMVGWCKIQLDPSLCEPGTTITLRHGEMLKPDGTLFTANLRFAKSRDKYIFIGSKEREFHPHFTYHGFRYVEVTGLRKGVRPDLVRGCAIASDTPMVGSFESSDPDLNKLWSNIVWTQRDNLISVPTDCPQRDERLGWQGDAQAFSQTAIFNMDVAAFYTKWIRDVREAQLKDGRYSAYAPNPLLKLGLKFDVNAPGWADCGLILPWNVYLNYGDLQIIQNHYASAKAFIDHVHAKNPGLIWEKSVGRNYGDWLNGDTIKAKNYPKKGGQVPKDVFATAQFANSTEILSKMATLLGYEKDVKHYSNLAKEIQKTFQEKFIDEGGKVKGYTQAGYAIALYFGLMPEELRQKAHEHMVKALELYDNRISTGFFSTIMLMMELTRSGNSDLAYELILSRRFPSWFYTIDQGATTIWERWDGYVEGRGFQSKYMNSFNHYAFGSVGEWMYRVILGINPDENQPGYKHVIIKPMPNRSLHWAKGSYNSIHGKIEVHWRLDGEIFELDITVPPNTTATIYILAANPDEITESGKLIDDIEEIFILGYESPTALIEISSGTYLFKSKIPKKEKKIE